VEGKANGPGWCVAHRGGAGKGVPSVRHQCGIRPEPTGHRHAGHARRGFRGRGGVCLM